MSEKKGQSLQDKIAAISEAMKLKPETIQAMENIKNNMQRYSIPDFSHHKLSIPEMPYVPTPEERNHYQSAAVLMKVLAAEALQWKQNLPSNFNPAILAILYGGIQIHVHNLSQVSFHVIRVEGTMNGSLCSVLAQQTTVQLLCYAEEVKPEETRNPIGFIWENKKIEV